MSTDVPDGQATQAHGQSTSIIASFGGIKYYIDPTPAQVISSQPSPPSDGFFRSLKSSLKGDLRPCTVMDYSNDRFDRQDLDDIISNVGLHDDVWTSAFMMGETSRRHKPTIEIDCLREDAS